MVSDERIRYWIEKVNAEIGRSDRNDFSFYYFKAQQDQFIFEDRKEWYCVLCPTVNMWGDKQLNVVSCYVLPEYRTGKYFLQLQKFIFSTSKRLGVVYTIQGSHIDDKYFKFLSGIGYKVSEMRKDMRNG